MLDSLSCAIHGKRKYRDLGHRETGQVVGMHSSCLGYNSYLNKNCSWYSISEPQRSKQ